MAGVRRNVAKVSQAERDKLRDAIVALDSMTYPDGVSFWDKQDAIHQATHVHGGPAFVPWHRELCNRFEALLQLVDPTVALHYWDWTTDPRSSPDGTGGFIDLLTTAFMGSASGRAGVPLDTLDNNGVFAGSRDDTGNPADPPQQITRSVAPGAPGLPADATIVGAGDGLPQAEQWPAFRMALEGAHNTAHGYIGGTIGSGHSAFEDPFVFLLHANVDRLWASWQRAPGQAWRLDPSQVYGNESADPAILEHMEPWAGVSGLRPWAPPENEQLAKHSRDPSVVAPPEYDDYATRPVEPPRVACRESCLSVTIRDSHHPCAPYASSGHSFEVEIYHCDGHPLFWNGVGFGAGVPLQAVGAGGGAIHGQFAVPPGCYLVRAAAPCQNVVTDWAWVNVSCGATVCVDLVPPTVRHCVERAAIGIAHGTVGPEEHVHDVAPREARTATNALNRLAAKLPADPLPAPPAQQPR
jgi:Common central domain of tyrosinase